MWRRPGTLRFAACGIQHAYSVGMAQNQRFSIRCKSNLGRRLALKKLRCLLSCFQIPEANAAILACRHHALPVREESQGRDLITMARVGSPLLPCLEVK